VPNHQLRLSFNQLALFASVFGREFDQNGLDARNCRIFIRLPKFEAIENALIFELS
jgi:hypothetical protein